MPMEHTMTATRAAHVETTPFTARRATFDSALSFDKLFDRLQTRIGKVAHLGNVVLQPGSLEEYERKAQESLGESGFVSIHEINFTHWLNKYGIRRRVFRWIIGNPLIAIRLMRHDPTAGLVLPFEVILTESEDGATSRVTYFVPSSLVDMTMDPELAAAAEELDAKIEALITSTADA